MKKLFLYSISYSYPSSPANVNKIPTQSLVIDFIDEDVLTRNDSEASGKFSPLSTPVGIQADDQIDISHNAQFLSTGEEKFQRSKDRKTISGGLKSSTGSSQAPNYCNISTGICQIPAMQAMAIVGLRSSSKPDEKETLVSDCFQPSRPKKSFTFSCGPLVRKTSKSSNTNTEDVLSTLLVTSSFPNLSPQMFTTKSTTFTHLTPFINPDTRSNLILNPVFENNRPHELSIPVEKLTSPSKG